MIMKLLPWGTACRGDNFMITAGGGPDTVDSRAGRVAGSGGAVPARPAARHGRLGTAAYLRGAAREGSPSGRWRWS
ncbi:hypothetical protein D7193_29770 [Micromonospora costi]|uniref:Uncharacterized protein n=1 Tax=Micromonospora costi TaxID=1530042 RepID=A0A3A9ZTF2_9ACTN|nr:hypothetical protein D7193_29770 [Micromonospora costi]